jgi:phage-related protein
LRSFTFNGVNSAVYGLTVTGAGTYNAPARDIESVAIPGRNGELTLDNGRFKNITVTYPAFVVPPFLENMRKIRAWLCSVRGYARLVDDYDPQYFRLARFVDGLEVEAKAINTAGEMNIQFDCMPQRFSIDGEFGIRYFPVARGATITNPEAFPALPIIKTNRAGTITVNGKEFTVPAADGGELTIDCEIQAAYSGNVSYNSLVSGEWPVLDPGENTLSWTAGMVGEIIPRWWTV